MSKTILAVDDSASIREMVQYTLEEAGYRVVGASNGLEALDQLKKNTVHMVLTDLNMPVMDGLELIVEIRKQKEYQFMPILLLTTETATERKQACKKAGATGWIVKPFSSEQLIKVIKKVMR